MKIRTKKSIMSAGIITDVIVAAAYVEASAKQDGINAGFSDGFSSGLSMQLVKISPTPLLREYQKRHFAEQKETAIDQEFARFYSK